MGEPGTTEKPDARGLSALHGPTDSPARQPRFASELAINSLFVITLLVVAANVAWFSLVPATFAVVWQRDWLLQHEPYGPDLLDRSANVIVGSPILGTCVAIAFACCWPFMGRTTTLRSMLIWAVALAFAICGWPVACGCITLEGFARVGGMAR